MDFLKVFAPNGRCPLEGGQGWIEQEPTQVPNTYFYRQMLASGDLVEATAPATPETQVAPVASEALPIANDIPPVRTRTSRGGPTQSDSNPTPESVPTEVSL